MRVGGRCRIFDVEFFELVAHDCGDIKPDRPLGSFAKCLGAHQPSRRKPARGTFHAHAKLGEAAAIRRNGRSEEHTSELQSLMRHSYAVFSFHNNTYTL